MTPPQLTGHTCVPVLSDSKALIALKISMNAVRVAPPANTGALASTPPALSGATARWDSRDQDVRSI